MTFTMMESENLVASVSRVPRLLLRLSCLLLLLAPSEGWLSNSFSTALSRRRHMATASSTFSSTSLSYKSNGNVTEGSIVASALLDKNLAVNASSTKTTASSTTLGDIMAKGGMTTESFVSTLTGGSSSAGSSKSQRQSLSSAFNFTNPLDRMVLTANGNLQRLLASYYDADITVVMEHQSPAWPFALNHWHRVVSLRIWDDVTLVRATSDVTIHNPQYQEWVASGKVGLGQLFRYGNILPEFVLHKAGRSEENHNPDDNKASAFWREYTLESDAVTCHIREEFCAGLWELEAPTSRDE